LRPRLVAANWKLNLGPAASARLARELSLDPGGTGRVVLFPTAISIPATVAAVEGRLEVGIQEVEEASHGAFTGSNSAALAHEAGCRWALIGHSERRQRYAESDDRVRARVVTTLKAGLSAMVCVGETLEEREANRARDVVERQVVRALEGADPADLSRVVLAYEPVWAIGTGRSASPTEVAEMHHFLRQVLSSTFGGAAEPVAVLYGGSVNASHAPALLSLPGVDGALVGGASLSAATFRPIVAALGASGPA
jgi:triosephosphate isomerase